MVRTGSSAQQFALGKVGGLMPDAGLCLQFTRTVFNVGPLYGSAIAAWRGAQHRHTGRPPRGAVVPVYFRTPSPYRHVCVALGSGKVVSTNGAKISLWKDIDQVAELFRGPYLGWSEDLNGVRVYSPAPVRTVRVTGVWDAATTKALQRRFGTTVDGTISGQVRTAANKNVASLRPGTTGSRLVLGMQRWLGVARSGQLDATTVRALQKRFGTKQDGVISKPSALVTAMQRALNAKASLFPAEDPVAVPPDLPGFPDLPDPGLIDLGLPAGIDLGIPPVLPDEALPAEAADVPAVVASEPVADPNVLADGSQLPPDPIDLGVLAPDDPSVSVTPPVTDDPDELAAPAGTDAVADDDPDLDPASRLGTRTQDSAVPPGAHVEVPARAGDAVATT